MASTNKALLLHIKRVLSEVVKRNSPFPTEGIIIGEPVTGGKPIAIDTFSSKSPNIIVWNKLLGQGLKILKVIAEFIFRYRNKAQMEFIVLTRHPEEWGELNKYGMGINGDTSCIGIIPFYSELAGKIVAGLARWSSENHKSRNHPIILLIDGMENLEKMDEDFCNHLRCVLDIGRRKNVYVVGTADRKNFAKVQKWLDGFQKEIYGSDAINLFETMIEQEVVFFITPETELI